MQGSKNESHAHCRTRCGSAACALGGQRAGRQVDGVRAVVKHGTIQVKGDDQDNSVAAYMTDLEDEVAEVTAVYIRAAVTELATLRGELFGPPLG